MIVSFNSIMELVCLLLSAFLAYRGEMASAAYIAAMAVYFAIKDATSEE